MTPDLNFDIVEKDSDLKSLGIRIDPASLDAWRNELPLTNASEAATLFIEHIRKINRARISAIDHFNSLQHLQLLAIEITETLRGRYSRAMLPLNERNRALHQLATQIYLELCVGLKSVLYETESSNVRSVENLKIMVQCLYWSLHNLSLLILEYYLIYAPIPAHCWEEANNLYRFAENYKLENISIRPDTPNEESGTIAFTYKRAILLSLSNPYHLMLEEASTLFDMLEKLAHVIQIYLIRSEEALDNCFVIDLRSDSAPFFISEHHKVQSFEPRLLDLKKLISVINVHITKLLEAQQKNEKEGKSSLMIRMQRDLLARLVSSWGRSQERTHERSTTFGKIELTIGLSSAHNNLSNGAHFMPELDEIHIHTEGLKNTGLDLSLLPKEFEHWKGEEAEKRLESGIDIHRQSHFDDQSAALDKWAKIYATNPKTERLEDEATSTITTTRYHASEWNIQNTSIGGMSLHCNIGKCAPVLVGEIIAYRDEDTDPGNWVLGTIRWLQALPDKTLNMGIMHLSKVMMPVAARAIKGIGKGGEYMRCIIIDSNRLDDSEASLIVPASIYDRGSELAINLGDRIEYIELTQYVIGTKSFAQYRYRVIERPDSEEENIRRLKQLI